MQEEKFILDKLRYFLIGTAFISPLIYGNGFVFPATFPRVIFLYVVVTIALALWLVHVYKSGELVLRKSWITLALLFYIVILFVSAIASGHFENALFSSHERMTGIITFVYGFGWYLVASSVLRPKDWLNVFRGFLFSGVIVALISYLGIEGLDFDYFRFLEQGGSLFGNNTFSGIYYLFAFFSGALLLAKDNVLKWRISYIATMLFIVFNPDIFNFKIWQGQYGIASIFSDPMALVGMARASSISILVGSLAIILSYVLHRLKFSTKIKGGLFGLGIATLLIVPIMFTISVVQGEGFGYNFLLSQKDTERPVVWQQGLEAFYNKPILGYGLNNFNYAFQDTFRPEVAFTNNSNWFDKIHSATLEPLVETGVIGTLALLFALGAVCWSGFDLYRKRRDFVVPIIIIVLATHFIQIQTAFNTAISLFMIAVFLAYLVSFSPKKVSYEVSPSTGGVILAGGLIVLAVMLMFFAIIPARQNRLVITAMASGNFDQRVELYEELSTMRGNAPKMILSVTEKFINALFDSLDEFNNPAAMEGLKIEFTRILDMHEAQIDKHGDNFRFLINYANMIHISRLFGVDRMDRAGELLSSAKELSTSYPQVYWLSALQAHYGGDSEKAFFETDKAIEMFEETKNNLSEYVIENRLGKVYRISENLREFIIESADIAEKSYYHVLEL